MNLCAPQAGRLRTFWLPLCLIFVSSPAGVGADEQIAQPAETKAPSAESPPAADSQSLVEETPQTGDSAPQSSTALPTDPELLQLIADLGSPVFLKRQNAVVALRTASPEQLQAMAAMLDANPGNEVIRRLLELLEMRYETAALGSPELTDVSAALEKAAISSRWFVAEAARDALDRHWQRRTELAIIDLVNLNVSLSPKDPAVLWKDDPTAEEPPFGIRNAASQKHLKIYIDKTWPSDPQVFAVLKRLDSMKGGSFLTQPRAISVYLIDGHPMTVEQVAILKGIFGDTQIAERGRVCLGILPEPRFVGGDESGIIVGDVQTGTSAHDAGIRRGDFIVALNGKKLSDFDELVTNLKQFDVGDKVMLHVHRSRFSNEEEAKSVEVTLKGWNPAL